MRAKACVPFWITGGAGMVRESTIIIVESVTYALHLSQSIDCVGIRSITSARLYIIEHDSLRLSDVIVLRLSLLLSPLSLLVSVEMARLARLKIGKGDTSS